MSLFRVAFALMLASCVSACGPAGEGNTDATATPAVSDAPRPAAPAAPAAPVEPAAPVARLWFEPAALPSCQSGKVLVSWDASAVKGLKNVELKILRSGGEEGQFARAGRVGSKETGDWMRAGRVIVLRNADDGAELARAKVGSLPCE